MDLSHHAVLAVVSHGCPPPKDRYLRVTHPSATDRLPCPCDLHVLSMPPAFALSQDQTLRFISTPGRPERINEQILSLSGCSVSDETILTSVSVTYKVDTSQTRPFETSNRKYEQHPSRPISAKPDPIHPKMNSKDAANVSLPSLCNSQRAAGPKPQETHAGEAPSRPANQAARRREAPFRPAIRGRQTKIDSPRKFFLEFT